jgi:RNA polymerase sigma-70 factor (ECF subfamily)
MILPARPFNPRGNSYNRRFLRHGNPKRMDEQSDEALMARIAAGDRAAFRVLAERHFGPVIALAGHVLGNRSDAEDVAQEAMLRVWVNAPRWKPVAKFRTWLTRVVINLCLDRRRRAAWLPLETAGEPADPAPGAEARLEAADSERRLAAAIGQLPERQRAALALTYGEGLSNAETADILDTSVSAVETLLSRAKATLRRVLADEE